MALGLKQKRILELLSINARFTNKDIGRAVGMSEDSVKYQITKLIDKMKLARFYTQFDYRFLGYDHYHVLVRVSDLDYDINPVKNLKSVTSVNSSYGKFDLQIIVIARNDPDFDKALEAIESALPIQDMAVARFVTYHKKFTDIIAPLALHTRPPANSRSMAYALSGRSHYYADFIKPIHLDSPDKRIIKELMNNTRIPFTEISRRTGLNHETVRYRMKRMIKSGFIRNFGLLHDYRKYGLYTNYLLLKLKNLDGRKFRDYLNKNENIFYSAKLIGEYNAIIYMTSKDPDGFASQLKGIRSILKDSIIDIDLLHLEDIQKYVQFPEGILDSSQKPL